MLSIFEQESSSKMKELGAHPIVMEQRAKLESSRDFWRTNIQTRLSEYAQVVIPRRIRFKGIPELETWQGGNELVKTEHAFVHDERGTGIHSKKTVREESADEAIFYFKQESNSVCLTGFLDKTGKFVDFETFDPSDPWQIEEWERASWKLLDFYVYDSLRLYVETFVIEEKRRTV